MTEQHDQIQQRLQEIKKRVKYLEKYRNITLEEYQENFERLSSIERNLQVCAEAAIDIAQIIIAMQSFPKPESGRDSILILAEHGVLDRQFAKKFVSVASFRNIVVHGYIAIDDKKVLKHLREDLGDFEKYGRQISRFILVKENKKQHALPHLKKHSKH